MVGHADLNTTDKYYTHLELEDIMKAVAVLDN
jgi:integrase